MASTPTFAPLLVLTVAQIVDRWSLAEDELTELMKMLVNHERKLMNGSRAYFLSDAERAVEELRAGR